MIARYRTQLRAWLIGAMRDAIRLEYYAQDALNKHHQPHANAQHSQSGHAASNAMPLYPAPKPVDAPIPDPSFEQMQAEAIQAQEKYYEPAK